MSSIDCDLTPVPLPAETQTLDELLAELVATRASDLHLKPGRPPLIRLNGMLTALDRPVLTAETIGRMLDPAIPERLRDRLDRELAIDFGHGVAGLSRFRASVFFQRGTMAAVFRRVPFDFPSLADWGMPPVLEDFCDPPQGLVLITGPTGSGKSSTLAAMMQRVVSNRYHHIVTIEDPIEFLINDDLGSVSQREIGIDTPSFATALKNVLRQDPDVIMVGEMRDEETIHTVLTAAETGHLVFSTLHTNDTVQTVDRIVNAFPDTNHRQIRQQLATCLIGVVSMQLVPRADGSGMVAAVEILRSTPQVRKLITDGDLQALYEAIEGSVAYHRMQTMNQSLAALIVHGTVTREVAAASSANPGELDLLLRKLVGARHDGVTEGDEMSESTNDFSHILKLQEVKHHYDELQTRYAEEIAARDHEILQLRGRVSELTGQGEELLASLRKENERLGEQLAITREEYEGKIQRLSARVKSLQQPKNGSTEAGGDPRKGGGFFRR